MSWFRQQKIFQCPVSQEPTTAYYFDDELSNRFKECNDAEDCLSTLCQSLHDRPPVQRFGCFMETQKVPEEYTPSAGAVSSFQEALKTALSGSSDQAQVLFQKAIMAKEGGDPEWEWGHLQFGEVKDEAGHWVNFTNLWESRKKQAQEKMQKGDQLIAYGSRYVVERGGKLLDILNGDKDITQERDQERQRFLGWQLTQKVEMPHVIFYTDFIDFPNADECTRTYLTDFDPVQTAVIIEMAIITALRDFYGIYAPQVVAPKISAIVFTNYEKIPETATHTFDCSRPPGSGCGGEFYPQMSCRADGVYDDAGNPGPRVDFTTPGIVHEVGHTFQHRYLARRSYPNGSVGPEVTWVGEGVAGYYQGFTSSLKRMIKSKDIHPVFFYPVEPTQTAQDNYIGFLTQESYCIFPNYPEEFENFLRQDFFERIRTFAKQIGKKEEDIPLDAHKHAFGAIFMSFMMQFDHGKYRSDYVRWLLTTTPSFNTFAQSVLKINPGEFDQKLGPALNALRNEFLIYITSLRLQLPKKLQSPPSWIDSYCSERYGHPSTRQGASSPAKASAPPSSTPFLTPYQCSYSRSH